MSFLNFINFGSLVRHKIKHWFNFCNKLLKSRLHLELLMNCRKCDLITNRYKQFNLNELKQFFQLK